MDPTFFETPADFRGWLEDHHASVDELVVGFFKKGSGRPSIHAGLMRPRGLVAFELRGDDRSAVYSYEQREDAALEPADERSFRANATGLGLLPRRGSLVSARGDVLGDEREGGRDSAPQARDAD